MGGQAGIILARGVKGILAIKHDLIEFPYKGRWQIKKVNINYKKTIMSLRVTNG